LNDASRKEDSKDTFHTRLNNARAGTLCTANFDEGELLLATGSTEGEGQQHKQERNPKAGSNAGPGSRLFDGLDIGFQRSKAIFDVVDFDWSVNAGTICFG
jgi:hypothetical protein